MTPMKQGVVDASLDFQAKCLTFFSIEKESKKINLPTKNIIFVAMKKMAKDKCLKSNG